MVEETLLLLRDVRRDDYDGSLSAYRRAGGMRALERVFHQNIAPAELIDLVHEAGLRGRGGAGFPTGLKWRFMARDTGKPSYLICNADESEPGTFKDHLLMDRDVFLFLEGMMLGCYALGCHHGYIYLRGESQRTARHLQQALAMLYEEDILGPRLLGEDYHLDLTLHLGAGAYICGEETALLDSLEGKRGQPRFKPPFPAVAGFDGCPTSVNNVETLANLPFLVLRGASAFREIGSENNSGTHLVSVSGHVERPGVYEVAMGEPLLGIIDDLAGGVRGGKALKGVIPGGASAPILTAAEADIPYDFDALTQADSMMGSSAVMVFDEDTDMVEVAWRTIRFFNHESCGQCTPCREGTFWLKQLIRDCRDGQASPAMLRRIDRVAAGLQGTTICAFGDATALPLRALVSKFAEDFRRRAAAA